MDGIKRLIDQAFGQLLVIPVSGDAVEAMANAKALLRKAFAEIDKKEQTDDRQEDR